jgi:hypothetical protein
MEEFLIDLNHTLTKRIGYHSFIVFVLVLDKGLYDPLDHSYFSNVRNKFGKQIREILSTPLIPLNPTHIIRHKFHKRLYKPAIKPINEVRDDSYSVKELSNPNVRSRVNKVKRNVSTQRITSQNFYYTNKTESSQNFWRNTYKNANIIKTNMQPTELLKNFNTHVRCMNAKRRKKVIIQSS